jgi:hypothetical protein
MDKNKWISVKDRLPKIAKMVLVCSGDDADSIGVYYRARGTGCWYPDGWPIENTTHWMPLPEPPDAI